jgi:hypothetical protein
MRWVFGIFVINLFGIGLFRIYWNFFDFGFKFEKIFESKIHPALSSMRGIAKIVLGNPLFQTYK